MKPNGAAVVLHRRLNGLKFCFELVAIRGALKGFIIVSTYLAREEAVATKIIQDAIDSFVSVNQDGTLIDAYN